jgi:hypothetical protein
MGKWRTGIALPTELLPRLVEQIGVEPMTDNPMSSAHQKKAGKKATVELPGVLKVAPPSQATERICTDIAGSTRTHNLRPAKETGKITSSSTLDIHCTAMYLSEP